MHVVSARLCTFASRSASTSCFACHVHHRTNALPFLTATLIVHCGMRPGPESAAARSCAQAPSCPWRIIVILLYVEMRCARRGLPALGRFLRCPCVRGGCFFASTGLYIWVWCWCRLAVLPAGLCGHVWWYLPVRLCTFYHRRSQLIINA